MSFAGSAQFHPSYQRRGRPVGGSVIGGLIPDSPPVVSPQPEPPKREFQYTSIFPDDPVFTLGDEMVMRMAFDLGIVLS